MRKQFIIFLILIFVLGLTPINFSTAITQNQIDAEVQIVCPDDYGNWYSGSGTIIDPKGIILTNKHVVTDKYGSIINTCFIGFIESISDEPVFGEGEVFNLAEVKYYTATDDMDAAILYLENPTSKTYPFINIWNLNSDTLQFGDKIEAIGFPSIGGSTITYTSGDFSGFGSQSDGTQNYIKSTAQLEHGNSGGASYNSKGQFIGIPTMVVAGSLNSLSYILSVNSIKNWLSGILGGGYQQEVIKQKPTIIEPTTNIQSDYTPPDITNFKIEFKKAIINNAGQEELTQAGVSWQPNYVIDKYNKIGFTISGAKDDSGINGYYYYFGKNLSINPVTNGKFIKYNNRYDGNSVMEPHNFQDIEKSYFLDEEGSYYFIISVKDKAGNITAPHIAVYNYEKDYYKKIKSLYFYKDSNYKTGLGSYDYQFTEDPNEYLGNGLWSRYSDSFDDILTCKTRLKDIYIEWDYSENVNKNGNVVKVANIDNMEKIEKGEVIQNNRYSINNINTGDKVRSTMEVWSNGSVWQEILQAGDKINYKIYIKPMIQNDEVFNKHKLINLIYNPNINEDITCISKYDLYTNKITNIAKELDFYHKNIKYNSLKEIKIDYSLADRLKGQILLQVESNGEAYYIYPDDSKRYYLGRPADAFNVMRELGLGATHQFINSYTIYPNHVLGKILIDVEQNGEAYYIYPKDKKAYYLGRPADAFKVMRELGLGITNSDLSKIPEGGL